MRRRVLLAAVLGAAALCAACSSGRGVRCEGSELYGSARSAAPVRVPDDLSLPDESEALTIPTVVPLPAPADPPATCLEDPPSFFQDARSG